MECIIRFPSMKEEMNMFVRIVMRVDVNSL
jgi:hypothetical protein